MSDDNRRDDYRAARIGAATALVGVLSVLLLLDAIVETYTISPITLTGLLASITTLLGIEGLAILRGRNDR